MLYAKNDFVFDWIVVGPSKVLSNIIRKEFPHDSIRFLFHILISRSVSSRKDLESFSSDLLE
jgi:hypothetical protein